MPKNDSERAKIKAAKLVQRRRSERGQEAGSLRAELQHLIARVQGHMRQLKQEQRRLMKVAATPGFRHQVSHEEAQAAWETRLASYRGPTRPPRPRPPRKGDPGSRKLNGSRFASDWRMAQQVGLEDFAQAGAELRARLAQLSGLKDLEPSSAEVVRARLAATAEPAPDLKELERRLEQALHPPGEEALPAPQQAMAIVHSLAGLLWNLQFIRKNVIPIVEPRGVTIAHLSEVPKRALEALHDIIDQERVYDPRQIVPRLMEKLKLSCKEEIVDVIILEEGYFDENLVYRDVFYWFEGLATQLKWSPLKKELLRRLWTEIVVDPAQEVAEEAAREAEAAKRELEMSEQARQEAIKLRQALADGGSEELEPVESFLYETQEERPIAEALAAWYTARYPPPRGWRTEIVLGRQDAKWFQTVMADCSVSAKPQPGAAPGCGGTAKPRLAARTTPIPAAKPVVASKKPVTSPDPQPIVPKPLPPESVVDEATDTHTQIIKQNNATDGFRLSPGSTYRESIFENPAMKDPDYGKPK